MRVNYDLFDIFCKVPGQLPPETSVMEDCLQYDTIRSFPCSPLLILIGVEDPRNPHYWSHTSDLNDMIYGCGLFRLFGLPVTCKAA